MTTNIIAHRGASRLAPENTMPAFKLAYKLGADGIETDVQLTKDNIPVLIHDEHVKRTANGRGFVKDFTFAELRKLDAGSWFSKKYTGTKIVSLDEFLQWIKPRPLYLNIELKNTKIDYKNLETIVYDMLKSYQLLDRTTLSTFNPVSVQRMQDLFSDVEIALLTSRRNRNLVHDAKRIGANALHIKYRLLTPSLVDACRRKKIKVRVYTVNRPIKMAKCFALKTDGIFTDVPDLGLEQRKQFHQTN
ncbi:glycerophosphoryl diester phosphodiesterase [Lentibacillus populi]|uniref:Glycerophosphoryl diester phosphodiesterase n=1 Tax=Lentibacillus populi TaxID=1827502 RepID=A0A9W5TV95_9BACI|nr:glycerophosphodiester phosphodiesterase [Virgibacillus dakarensis]GGB34361.1 glycerophosphoryl diester phosphodiesterase [Lentibacillus populi]